MRNLLWLICLFLPLTAMAVDPDSTVSFPRGELFGGYSYFHAGDSGGNFSGLNASIAENLRPWFGGALEVSSHWSSGTNVSTFMYGPVFSYRKDPRITPFVHFLAGGVSGSTGYLDISHGKATFGLATGGGVDVQVTKNLAIRVAQVDYVLSRFSATQQSNFRFSAGLVYRFGFRK
jgi:opacity protein-like surface antigen